MTDLELDELERLAKAATQGDVRIEQIARSAIDDQEPVRPGLVIPKPGDDLQALSVIAYGFFRQADANYYAAAQPQNLLPFIRELRGLRKVAAEARKVAGELLISENCPIAGDAAADYCEQFAKRLLVVLTDSPHQLQPGNLEDKSDG